MSDKKEKVLERVYDRQRLETSWRQVRKNDGAAGMDEMTVADFGRREAELMPMIQRKLEAGVYRFKPARRVEIEKPGSDKKRKLGIPVVMDRVVAQSMNLALEEIFEPLFRPSNFGYRKGKSQHRAIGHVRQAVMEGYRWCASIDLSRFFDEIPHGLILKLIRKKIKDERMVTLIARALTSGVMAGGVLEETVKGTPQGSPLSPILSNVVLNEMDWELEKRGLRYCRWADDFLILVKTKRAAERVMKNIIRYLEEKLGLLVNREKSRVAPVKDVSFLGFQIQRGKIRIGKKVERRFKEKVRTLTERNNPLSMYEVIQRVNEYLDGWIGYYRVQEFREKLGELDRFLRQRLRSVQLRKWKTPKKFRRILIKAGWKFWDGKPGWVRMDRWRSVHRKEVRYVLSLNWFRKQGLRFLADWSPQTLELAFSR